MANIAAVLKEEIARHARKELRGETESLKKASSRYRAEIAALKRRVAALEQLVSRLEKLAAREPGSRPAPEAVAIRFRADGLKKHRERLGLSAPALASILGVSPQTIYNWESGTSRPSKAQVVKIAILRKMGKREVQERLAQMRSA